jgi:hypothetical protein
LWPFPPRGKIFWANDESGIVDAIRDFKSDNSLKAMIVSVDPFFQSHKERLIKKANEAPKKHMCYPFQIYANTGHTAPDSGHHTKHGHKLASAYYDLGRKAAFVITHDGSPSDLSSPSNPPETHEG